MLEKEVKEMIHSFLSYRNEMQSYADNNTNKDNEKAFNNILNLLDDLEDYITEIEENENFNF